VLDLTGNHIINVGKNGVQALGAALGGLHELHTLRLGDTNMIGDVMKELWLHDGNSNLFVKDRNTQCVCQLSWTLTATLCVFMHTRTHTHTRTRTHTRAHRRTQTHTHTHIAYIVDSYFYEHAHTISPSLLWTYPHAHKLSLSRARTHTVGFMKTTRPRNCHILRLYLARNGFHTEGCKALAKVLEHLVEFLKSPLCSHCI